MARITDRLKKTIGFDLDDTIIDHNPNRKILAKKMNRPASDRELKKILYAEMALNSPPISGSLKTIRQLFKNGHRVIIVSRNKTPKFSRRWLKRYLPEIKPRDIFFVKENKDKAKICQQEKVAIFIDDLPEVLSFLDKKIVKILFHRRKKLITNQYLVATNWSQIKQLLEK